MRIAIIGGGIGGCATAYLARTILQKSKVTLYEKNGLGGRILTHDVDGWKREVGATFFTSSNKMVMSLVDELDLGTWDIGASASIGVWDGIDYVFKSRFSPLFTKLKLASKYRIDLIRLTSLIEKARRDIRKLYEEAERDPRDLRDLLNDTGLNSWLDKSFLEILEEENVDSSIIEAVIEPLIRLIYNQGAEINGFAGLMTLIGVSDRHLLKLKAGNITLPIKLADSSRATIKLGHEVDRIEKNSDGSIQVVGKNFSEEHDAVVLAAPIELLNIDLDDVLEADIKSREFQKVYIKIVKGDIEPRYFGMKNPEELPRILLTTSKASFSNLQTIGKTSNGQKLFSITHSEPLTQNFLSQIFSTQVTMFEHVWEHAYPIFKPGLEMMPSILGSGVLYLNSLETAVSSMESSSFAAMNIVKLIRADR